MQSTGSTKFQHTNLQLSQIHKLHTKEFLANLLGVGLLQSREQLLFKKTLPNLVVCTCQAVHLWHCVKVIHLVTGKLTMVKIPGCCLQAENVLTREAQGSDSLVLHGQ